MQGVRRKMGGDRRQGKIGEIGEIGEVGQRLEPHVAVEAGVEKSTGEGTKKYNPELTTPN